MSNEIPVLAPNFARALSSLLKGMTFPSESDYPFEPFWAELSSGSPFDADSFRKAARIGRRYEIRIEPAQDILRRLAETWEELVAESGASEYEEYAATFRMLETVMSAALSDVTYVHVGGEDVVRARVFLLGRLPDGRLAGVRSISIET